MILFICLNCFWIWKLEKIWCDIERTDWFIGFSSMDIYWNISMCCDDKGPILVMRVVEVGPLKAIQHDHGVDRE